MRRSSTNELSGLETKLNRSVGLLTSITIVSLLALSLSEFGGTEIAGVSGRFWRLIAVSLCVWLIFVYVTHSRSLKQLTVLAPFFGGAGALFVYLIVRAVFDPQANYDETVKQLISTGLMFALFIAVASRHWLDQDLRFIGFLTLFAVSAVFTTWILDGMPFIDYSAFEWNPNGFGFVMMIAMMFLVLSLIQAKGKVEQVFMITGILMGAIMLLASTSRAPIAGTFIAFGFYWLWPKISRSRTLYIWISAAFIMSCFAFPFIYVHFLSDSQDIQTEEGTLFSKRLATRSDTYSKALEIVDRSPWFGEGLRSAETLQGSNLIELPHNETLYLLMQGGLAGLILYFCYLLSIFLLLMRGAKDNICRVSGAAFFGFLFYSNFEQIMIVSTLSNSLLAYLVIGIGISRGNDHRKSLYKPKA